MKFHHVDSICSPANYVSIFVNVAFGVGGVVKNRSFIKHE